LPKTSEAVQAAKPRPALSYRAVIPAPDAWPPIKIRSSRDLTYDWIVRGIYLYGITALAILPMAAMAGPELPTILPFFAASVLITELSTSFLLFVWARASRTWSLLILACTYLFGGLMALFYLLTLPSGLIPDQAILGTALQSPGLLLNFWVTGYAILALIAILLEINGGQIRAARIGRAIQLAIVGALAAVLTGAALATIGRDWFPPIVRDQAWTDFTKIFVATDLMLLIVGIERAIRQRNVIFLLQGLSGAIYLGLVCRAAELVRVGLYPVSVLYRAVRTPAEIPDPLPRSAGRTGRRADPGTDPFDCAARSSAARRARQDRRDRA
jgi:hypothetical protein